MRIINDTWQNEMGGSSPGRVAGALNDGAGKNYGIASFTEKWDLKNVVEYMKKNYNDLYKKLDMPIASTKFDKSWEKLGKTDRNRFLEAQANYLIQSKLIPHIKKIKSNTGVNIGNGDYTEGLASLLLSAINWAPGWVETQSDQFIKKGENSKKIIKRLINWLVSKSTGTYGAALRDRWQNRQGPHSLKMNRKFKISDLGVVSSGSSNSSSSLSSSSSNPVGNYISQIGAIYSDAFSKIFGGNDSSSNDSLSSDTDSTEIGGKGVERLLNIARNELDYQEKASNKNLNSKHKNAGMNNYTKYGVFTGTNGLAWCASFVSWLFDQAFKKKGNKVIRGNYSAAVDGLHSNFVNANAMKKIPQPGDVIIYKNGTSHTGIVESVNKKKKTFTSIEGNTSGGPSGFNPDGGVVARKKDRPWNYSSVTGFGRPDWSKAGSGSGLLDIITNGRPDSNTNLNKLISGAGSSNKKISKKKMTKKILEYMENGNNLQAIEIVYNKIFTDDDPSGLKAITNSSSNKKITSKEYIKFMKSIIKGFSNIDNRLVELSETVKIEKEIFNFLQLFAEKLINLRTAENQINTEMINRNNNSNEVDKEFQELLNTLVELAK
jgi:hypothetical protein